MSQSDIEIVREALESSRKVCQRHGAHFTMDACDDALKALDRLEAQESREDEACVYVDPASLKAALHLGHGVTELTVLKQGRCTAPLYTSKQALSAIPDEKYPTDGGGGDEDAYNRGWNDCRAMLSAAPQPPHKADGGVKGEAAWKCGVCFQMNSGWAKECGRCESPQGATVELQSKPQPDPERIERGDEREEFEKWWRENYSGLMLEVIEGEYYYETAGMAFRGWKARAALSVKVMP